MPRVNADFALGNLFIGHFANVLDYFGARF